MNHRTSPPQFYIFIKPILWTLSPQLWPTICFLHFYKMIYSDELYTWRHGVRVDGCVWPLSLGIVSSRSILLTGHLFITKDTEFYRTIMTFGAFPLFVSYEKCCREHSCILSIAFFFFFSTKGQIPGPCSTIIVLQSYVSNLLSLLK